MCIEYGDQQGITYGCRVQHHDGHDTTYTTDCVVEWSEIFRLRASRRRYEGHVTRLGLLDGVLNSQAPRCEPLDIRPEKFFRQQVLAQPDVKKWIVDRLDFFSRAMEASSKDWRAMEGAVDFVGDRRAPSQMAVSMYMEALEQVNSQAIGVFHSPPFYLYPGVLTGGPPTGASVADVQGSRNKNVQMENLYGQSGERGLVCTIHGAGRRLHERAQQRGVAGLAHETLPQERDRDITTASGQYPPVSYYTLNFFGRSREQDPSATSNNHLSLIDWKKHQAQFIGLQTTGEDTDVRDTADDDDAVTEHTDNDGPLDKMVVSDLPYNRDLSG
ncbi:hypothetical protein F4679DRAFT_583216 [Xylaria curta]|nr:hypothetical protein F4679DRAFT_583216 [Xylaria curta]